MCLVTKIRLWRFVHIRVLFLELLSVLISALKPPKIVAKFHVKGPIYAAVDSCARAATAHFLHRLFGGVHSSFISLRCFVTGMFDVS